jgi:hypothetical protein
MDLKQLTESRQQTIVDAVKRKIKSSPSLMAQHIGIPSGMKALSSQGEREAYWTPDPDVIANSQQYYEEVAQAALMSAKPEETPEAMLQRTKNLFALRMYPGRLDLIRSGSRGLSVDEQIKFSERMMELGPPEEEMA